MLTLLLLLATAPAAEPPPLTDVAAYNDAVLTVERALARRVRRLSDELLLQDAPFPTLAAALRTEIATARRHAAELGGFEGDTTLGDAVTAALTGLDALVDAELATLAGLVAEPTPAPFDTARMEAVWTSIQDRSAGFDQEVAEAQRAFADRHAMRVVPTAPEPRSWADFQAKGFPPEGSRLPGQFHVLLAVRRANHAQALGDRLTLALDAYVQAVNTQADMEARRVAAVAAAGEAKRAADALVGPTGPTPLSTAATAYATAAATWLEGPGAELVTLLSGPITTQEQADRINGLVDGLNQTLTGAQAGLRAAHEAAVKAVPTAAYEAWLAEARKAAKGRLEAGR